jgi:hypothetical protein
VRSTRIIGGLSVLVLSAAVVWDFASDGFWSRHALFTGLVASLIVVAVTAAVLNEVLERRQRQRWSVLAQYALFDLVSTARLVWTGLLELAGLVPDGEFEDGALEAGSEAVLDTPRLAAAIDEMLASPDRREQLHRLIARLRAHGEEVLGRWADVMVNSGTYAEIVDRHVELYSRLYWWGSVLDESDTLEERADRASHDPCDSPPALPLSGRRRELDAEVVLESPEEVKMLARPEQPDGRAELRLPVRPGRRSGRRRRRRGHLPRSKR